MMRTTASGGWSAAAVLATSPKRAALSEAYDICTEPSADAPFVTMKLVQAKLWWASDRSANGRRRAIAIGRHAIGRHAIGRNPWTHVAEPEALAIFDETRSNGSCQTE
jgi:hypothetical protein